MSSSLKQERFLAQVTQSYLAVLRIEAGANQPLRLPFKEAVRAFERVLVQAVLNETIGPGQYNEASKRLNLHRNSFRVKLRELKLYVRKRQIISRRPFDAKDIG